MQIAYGTPADIAEWMALVERVSPVFPGLETPQRIEEHRQTVLKFMSRGEALCAKCEGSIAGVLLFSKKHNMICCLAVSPDHRRMGIASAMLTEALGKLDRSREITVSTFCEDDPMGIAPRALYRKFGFVEDELLIEFGYPNQNFILCP